MLPIFLLCTISATNDSSSSMTREDIKESHRDAAWDQVAVAANKLLDAPKQFSTCWRKISC